MNESSENRSSLPKFKLNLKEWLRIELENSRTDRIKQALILYDIAKLLKKSGAIKDSIKGLELSIASEKSVLPAIWELIAYYRENRNWKRLVELYETEEKVTPKTLNPILQEIKIMMGEIYEDWLKDKNKALSLYQEAQNIDDTNPYPFITLAQFYAKENKLQELVEVLYKLCEITEDRQRKASLYSEIASLYLEMDENNFPLAIEALKHAYNSGGEKWVFLSKIETLAERHNLIDELIFALTEKANFLEELSKLNSDEISRKAIELGALVDDPELAKYMAAYLWKRVAKLEEEANNNIEKAIESIKRSYNLLPDNFIILMDYFTYLKKGLKYDEAQEVAGIISSLTSDKTISVLLHLFLSEIALVVGKKDEALENLFAALKASPELSSIWSYIESIYLMDKKYEELTEHYQKILPQLEDPILKKAIILRLIALKQSKGDYQGAFNLIKELVSNNEKERLNLWVLEYEFLFRLNKWKEMVELLEWVGEKVTSTQLKTAFLTASFIIKIDILKEEVEEYKVLLEKLVEIDSNNRWANVLLAKASMELKEWDRASKLWEKVASLTEFLELKADFYYMAGLCAYKADKNLSEAERYWKNSIEYNPNNLLAITSLIYLYNDKKDVEALKQLFETLNSLENRLLFNKYALQLGLIMEGLIEFDYAKLIYDNISLNNDIYSQFALIRELFVCLRQNDISKLVNLIEDKLLNLIENEKDRAFWYRELGIIYLDILKENRKGTDYLEKAYNIYKGDTFIFLSLLEAYLSNFEINRVRSLIEEQLTHNPGSFKLPWITEIVIPILIAHEDEDGIELLKKLFTIVEDEPLIKESPIVQWAKWLYNSKEKVEDKKDRRSIWSKTEGEGILLLDYIIEGILNNTITQTELNNSLNMVPDIISDVIPIHILVDSIENLEKLKSKIEILPEPIQKFWIALVALIAEYKGDLETAYNYYTKLRSLDRTSFIGITGIIRVGVLLEKWNDVYESLINLSNNFSINNEVKLGCMKLAAAIAASKLNKTNEAISLWKEIQALYPLDKESFSYLYFFYEKNKDYDSLYELIQNRITYIDEPEELEALFWKLAQYNVRKQDYSSALYNIENVLLFNESAIPLRAKLDLLLRLGDYQEALDTVKTLLNKEESKEEREKVLSLAINLVEEKISTPQEGINLIKEIAEKFNIREIELFQKSFKLARDNENWEDALWSLEQLVALEEDIDKKVEYLNSIANIYIKRLNKSNEVFKYYKRILELDPENTMALKELVKYTEDKDRLNEVLEELDSFYMTKSHEKLLNPHILTNLYFLYESKGEEERAFAVKNLMYALGCLETEENNKMEIYIAQSPNIPSKYLSQNSIENLLTDPDENKVWGKVIKVIGDSISKIFNLTFITNVKPFSSKSPIQDIILKVAKLINLEELYFYQGGKDPFGFSALPLKDGKVIAIGEQVTSELDRRQLFILGKTLWEIRASTGGLYGRSQNEILSLFVGAWMEAKNIEQPPKEINIPGLEVIRRALNKHLSRKQKKQLEELLGSLETLNLEEIKRWYWGVESSGAKFGLLLSGDISSAFSVIIPNWHGADVEERKSSSELVRKNPLGIKISRFFISNEYISLRKELELKFI